MYINTTLRLKNSPMLLADCLVLQHNSIITPCLSTHKNTDQTLATFVFELFLHRLFHFLLRETTLRVYNTFVVLFLAKVHAICSD